MSTLSTARKAPFTSATKSANPGVSRKLIFDIVPFNRRKGRTDRNTALDFLWLKVRCCLSILHFAHPADGAAAIKQGFRKGSRPCTAVPYNSNVPDFITCVLFSRYCPLYIESIRNNLMVSFFADFLEFSFFSCMTFLNGKKRLLICIVSYRSRGVSLP